MNMATLNEEQLNTFYTNKANVEKIGKAKYRMTDKEDKKKSYQLRKNRKNRRKFVEEA